VSTISLIPIYYRSQAEYQKWYETQVSKLVQQGTNLATMGQEHSGRSVSERARIQAGRGIPTWKFNEQVGFIELGHINDTVYANVWLDHYMYPCFGTQEPPKNPRLASSRRPRFEQFEHMAFHFKLSDPFIPLVGNSVAEEVIYRLKMVIATYLTNEVFQARTKKIWFDTEPTFKLVRVIDWAKLVAD